MYETAVSPPNGSHPMPSLEGGSVAAAMHRGIVSCEPDATLTEVARVMARHHIHCLAVIGVSHQRPECGV
jgi:CBS domain-containing protein